MINLTTKTIFIKNGKGGYTEFKPMMPNFEPTFLTELNPNQSISHMDSNFEYHSFFPVRISIEKLDLLRRALSEDSIVNFPLFTMLHTFGGSDFKKGLYTFNERCVEREDPNGIYLYALIGAPHKDCPPR